MTDNAGMTGAPNEMNGHEMTTEIWAEELHEAFTTRRPTEPLSARHPELTIEDAYAIQRHLVERWTKQGKRVVGRKIGLTSAAMQVQLGVSQPDFGVITDDMVIRSGEQAPLGRFIAARVEPELAFVFDTDVSGPTVRPEDIVRAVSWVSPAIEIIDSRIHDWRIGIVDTIADNASSGAVVLGEPVALDGLDVRGMGCVLRCDAEIRATGAGGAVLGSPLRALAWLARTLDAFDEGIRAGEVVIPGSITKAQAVRPGEHWTADFSGAGRVSVQFTEGK